MSDILELDIIEEPEEDFAPRSTIRSVPRFPSGDGPTHSGLSWSDYYEQVIKAPYAADPDEDEEAGEVEVIERGYDLQEPLRAPGAAGTLARRLHAGGWTVSVSRSLARVPATLYKTASDDHDKGDVRYSAYELETHVVLGVKRAGGRMMAIEATWNSKDGFVSATTHDPVIGRERRSTMLKPRKQYAWEIEEDVEPPMPLNEWLALVCPKPVKKTTPKKKEAA